ncbi:histidine phosphatase family protein [Deinococcus radiophilus]|uniref:histidine phosphatase family protein n=1 Tax=Deinococcus radiophilus TaxID=32062 RepID=UPI00361A099C
MTESGTLILARHGRTALNAAGRFQGQTQTPLDELGRAQAQAWPRSSTPMGCENPRSIPAICPAPSRLLRPCKSGWAGHSTPTPRCAK